MAMVERCELGLVEPLDNAKDGSIDEADVGVGIAVTDLSYTAVVGGVQLFDVVRACFDITQKAHEHARMKPSADPIVDFHEYGRRDHDSLVREFDQRS